MSDETKTTARGFVIYDEWQDSHGHTIRVQESSAAGGGVWIFTEDAEHGHTVNHWRAGGGWERAPRVGEGDPPPKPGDPLRPPSEGWSSISPHLSVDDCRRLIAALTAHIERAEGSP